ncbi:hypothetical protein FOMPIDRAFT_1024510 [Fomitopsis schrenkii]|uniref:Uncharacterized protein n=1 Tax=Fomitopsis schrenkii TaxID=2126942 RepID=S8FKE3_FOMSC|nr:hypothetical protein FOMPIDRAFT_1024510 [Fomitopsis schrenkii]
MEVKQSRRTLEAALERLQGETQRAQLAEQRALELAARFKHVNDARIVAQRESDRLAQELQLYKNQLDVAQKELLRGEDLMRDLEAQRDDAEAVAARARSVARRLREQQLVFQAREDGRRMGYEEGLRRGYDEAGVTPPPRDARLPLGAQMQDGDEDEDDGVLNAPSAHTGAIPLVPPSDVDTYDDPGPSRRRTRDYGAGPQGSRFTENMTPATVASVPLPDPRQSTGPQPWPAPPSTTDEEGWPRPTPIRTASPAPHHPTYTVLPDNWVPSLNEDNGISIPPPHELSRPPPALGQADGGPRERTDSRQDLSAHRRPVSPRSITESLPSTHISEFDILSAPRRPNGRDRGSVLSAIPEAEFSPPASDPRRRSSAMPEPITFPAPSPQPESGYVGSDTGRRPGSRNSRVDDVSAAGSSRRRRPAVQDEQPEEVRRSIANVTEWIEKQTPPQSVRSVLSFVRLE